MTGDPHDGLAARLRLGELGDFLVAEIVEAESVEGALYALPGEPL
ncbi:MAG TPA: hypothetical protein VJU82_01425 [Acidobacteriaceae bacterium]|nr:hypothetical protein [Acidobacteriaceae bacterium]